jgi:DNA-binding SARP family transcriptional activator
MSTEALKRLKRTLGGDASPGCVACGEPIAADARFAYADPQGRILIHERCPEHREREMRHYKAVEALTRITDRLHELLGPEETAALNRHRTQLEHAVKSAEARKRAESACDHLNDLIQEHGADNEELMRQELRGARDQVALLWACLP